jgi:hypothetical protein
VGDFQFYTSGIDQCCIQPEPGAQPRGSISISDLALAALYDSAVVLHINLRVALLCREELKLAEEEAVCH